MPELWEVKGAAKIRLFGPKDALDRVQTPAGVNARVTMTSEVRSQTGQELVR